MKEIPLTQGKVAIVDDEDLEALTAFKWCALRGKRTFYAVRHVPRPGGGRKMEKLHRVRLARKLGRPLMPGEKTDHENGDGLDNQRENLRVATSAQNNRNRHHRVANPSSQYLGVTWHKRYGKWQVCIRVNGKDVFLGRHVTELQAAQAREAYITAHPELCARKNFTQIMQGDTQ